MPKKIPAFLKIILIIGVLLLLPFIPVWVNRLYSGSLDKSYPVLQTGLSSAHYTLKQIKTTGEFQQQDDAAVNVTDDTIVTPPVAGMLLFDTLALNFKIEQKNQVESKDDGAPDDHRYSYLTIDTAGNIIAEKERDNTDTTGAITRNCIALVDDLPEFPKWSDNTQPVYMRYFSKNEFNMPSLNPFKGLVLSNGGGVFYYWYGYGYYQLSYRNEILKFKARCYSDKMFSANDRDYETGLHYYKVPAKYQSKVNVAFFTHVIYNAPEILPHSLYIIKRR